MLVCHQKPGNYFRHYELASKTFLIGVINHLTTKKNVMKLSLKIAKELSKKPQHAMRLTKKRIWEIFKTEMDETFKSAKKYHKMSFKLGEPQKTTRKFLKK